MKDVTIRSMNRGGFFHIIAGIFLGLCIVFGGAYFLLQQNKSEFTNEEALVLQNIIKAEEKEVDGAAPSSFKIEKLTALVAGFDTPHLQGDMVILEFEGNDLIVSEAFFDAEPVSFFSYQNSYRAIFGIPAKKKAGTYPLHIVFTNGEVFNESVGVSGREFIKIDLGIPEKLNLTPQGLIEELVVKQKSLEDFMEVATPYILINEKFDLPLKGNPIVSSPYGEIRKTGGEEIRHLGVDFDVPRGTSVYAMNDGVVRGAYFDTIYGNSVILDHGAGMYSLYLHLDTMAVSENESVERGAFIGAVGDTGYSSSAHLHLSFKINGVSVDPLRLVENFK